MYLFDTDALTTILKPRPPAKLLKKLNSTSAKEQFTSTITISEIVYGACKSDRREYHLHNLENILLPSINVLSFDAKAAYVAGEIRASLERQGTPLQFADIQIAAIAISNDLVLITGNTSHFNRIPNLICENWLQ